jgi:hypothetical protein
MPSLLAPALRRATNLASTDSARRRSAPTTNRADSRGDSTGVGCRRIRRLCTGAYARSACWPTRPCIWVVGRALQTGCSCPVRSRSSRNCAAAKPCTSRAIRRRTVSLRVIVPGFVPSQAQRRRQAGRATRAMSCRALRDWGYRHVRRRPSCDPSPWTMRSGRRCWRA